MKTLSIILCCLLTLKMSLAQKVTLKRSDTLKISPFYSTENLLKKDTIKFKLFLEEPKQIKANITLSFFLDCASISSSSNRPQLPLSDIVISKERWKYSTESGNIIDTFLIIQIASSTDTLKREEIARLWIKGQPENYVQLRLVTKEKQKTKEKVGNISLVAKSLVKLISPYEDDLDAPQVDTIPVTLTFKGNYSNTNNNVHFYLDTPQLINKLQIINSVITLDSLTWSKGHLDTNIFVHSIAVVDTGTLKSSYTSLKIKEDTLHGITVWMTYKNKRIWYKKSNFFIGSFIKSISGTTAQNELLDLFIKVNLTSKEGLDADKRLWFGFFGADAALTSDTIGKRGVPLNEATVSINFAPLSIKVKNKPINHYSTRTGFIGAGLKVFYTNAYFGAHIGITELSGALKHSYLLAGFYHSPWKFDNIVQDSSKTPVNYFKNNIYIEGAFNAFGENAPKALQFIRLKFGLMLPVKFKDPVSPTNNDFLYRLAVEVPIGGPLRF